MRLLLAGALISCGFALTSCDYFRGSEEVRACRVFTKDQLRSPATYREVRANTLDSLISEADLRTRYLADPNDEVDRMVMAMARGHQLQIRSVILEYDADNAYGTPIRGLGGCDFLLIDGRIWGSGSLESQAATTASMVKLHDLTSQLGDHGLEEDTARHGTGPACCVR
jgi:hypothetical protein